MFDPNEVTEVVSVGTWNIAVEIRKNKEQRVYTGAVVELGTVSIRYGDEYKDRSALEARDSETGEFLGRISLNDFEAIDSGFTAEGVGFRERTTGPTKSAKGRALSAGDNYDGDSPAIHFWQATRL